jgi:hypothetical protein
MIKMKTKLKKMLCWLFMWIGLFWWVLGLNVANWAGGNGNNFDSVMVSSTQSIQSHLDNKIVEWSNRDTALAIIQKVIDVFFEVMVVVWVLVAMIGFYQILTSGDESKIKTWVLTLLYWVLWIILMYSAKYLTSVIFWIYTTTSWSVVTSLSTVEIIRTIYDDMMYPFIKIAIYLSLWILVILMMFRVFTYITSQDESTKKKSMMVIVWTTIGMLIISWAKQIVEAVYWNQTSVMSGKTNLSWIGSTIFDPSEIPIVYSVINWALWLTAFVLLVMIIIQTYKILTKPDDAATFTSLKKTIIYALAWILLIWAAYLLSNLFIIW